MKEYLINKISVLKISILSILLIDVVNNIPLDVLVKTIVQLIIGGISIYKLLKKTNKNEPNNDKK